MIQYFYYTIILIGTFGKWRQVVLSYNATLVPSNSAKPDPDKNRTLTASLPLFSQPDKPHSQISTAFHVWKWGAFVFGWLLRWCDNELNECISMTDGCPALLTFGLLFTEPSSCRDTHTPTQSPNPFRNNLKNLPTSLIIHCYSTRMEFFHL